MEYRAAVISVILPIYNQSSVIKKICNEYPAGLNTLGVPWEILLIINGSTDDSFSLASELTGNDFNIRVYNIIEQGWGRSVKFGISVSSGDFICYTNSARTNIDDLVMILKYALINKNIVIKANRMMRESVIRKFASTLYNLEYRLLFKIPVWDVNGTPKVFSSAILREIELQEDGDLIDAEIMAKSFRKKIMFIDIPILNTRRISGKSTTNLVSALKMYSGLIFLRNRI
jgi:glycosyltransferase involved in cell wall biosynthesis